MKTFLSRTQSLIHKRTLVAAALVTLAAAGVCWPLGQDSAVFGQFPSAPLQSAPQAAQPGMMPAGRAATQPPVNPSEFSQNASRHGVAVVDISFLFKNHVRFKQQMDQMKAEMENIEQRLTAERERIKNMETERNTFKPDTEEYRNRDVQLAKSMADFQINMNQLRKDFLDREAKVYYITYKEIVDAVGLYATQNNIALVIRFNGDEGVDTNQREAILKEINKPVVFQNKVDITPVIRDMVNRGQAPAQPLIGSRPGGTPQAQPPGTMLPR